MKRNYRQELLRYANSLGIYIVDAPRVNNAIQLRVAKMAVDTLSEMFKTTDYCEGTIYQEIYDVSVTARRADHL